MNRDIIIPVTCSILIFISSILLYIDFTGRIEHAGTDKIGTITFKKKVAERKYSGEVIWEELEQSVPVYNNDSIRTAEDSISIIKFKDRSEIEISENSFILLTWTDEGASVEFSKGAISARTVDSPGSKLKILSAGVSVNVNRGNARFSKTADKKLRVDVSSGTALIENQKGTSTVTQDSSAVISNDKTDIKKKTIKLLYPEPDTYFITHSDTGEVSFRWQADSDDEIYFEAYSDAGLTKKAVGKRAADPAIKYSFEPGTYYWRITDGKDGKTGSEVRRLAVLKDNAVLPLSPGEGKVLPALRENPIVNFQWTGSLYASSYEVIISGDPKFQKILQTLKSGGTDISTDKLSFGVYYWTVRGIYPFAKIGSAGENFIRKFTVIKEKIISPPVLLSPSENESISYVRLINKDAVFSWISSDEIERYEIIISKDKAGSDITLKAETGNNYFKFSDTLSPGKYYLSVAGILTGGARTRRSESRAFDVSRPIKLVTVSPADGAVVDSSPDQKLCFKWNDENKGAKYLFESAGDTNFQNILYRGYSDSKDICVQVELKGTFFWRASLVDNDDKVLISSNISQARISAEMKDPEILSPQNNRTIDMTDQDSLSFSWKKVEGANQYRIRIFQSSAGTGRQIFEKNTPGLNISFTRMELLDKGIFYWELQAFYLSDKKIIKTSRAVKNTFTLKLEEPVKAPDIISSDTLYIK